MTHPLALSEEECERREQAIAKHGIIQGARVLGIAESALRAFTHKRHGPKRGRFNDKGRFEALRENVQLHRDLAEATALLAQFVASCEKRARLPLAFRVAYDASVAFLRGHSDESEERA